MNDFQGMLKHVGTLNNTGKNVVVAFMRIPGDPQHALVIDTDALPDAFNEFLRKIVESVEGQQTINIGEVLGRRNSPDGSNMTILQQLHQANKLERVPVSLVTMTPRRGTRWPLVEVIKAIDAEKAEAPIGFDDLDPADKAALAADLKLFNVHAQNLTEGANASRNEEAIGLLRHAELLEADAHQMRIKAYTINPSLAPRKAAKEKAVLIEEIPAKPAITKAVKPKKTTIVEAPTPAKPKKPIAVKVKKAE